MSGFASQRYLRYLGLLNVDSPDLRDLSQEPKKEFKASYCSSFSCMEKLPKNRRRNITMQGKLVGVGEKYLKLCPNCIMPIVYCELVSEWVYDNFMANHSRRSKK